MFKIKENKKQIQILKVLELENRELERKELMNKTGIDGKHIDRDLSPLLEAGKILKRTEGKMVYYSLPKVELPPPIIRKEQDVRFTEYSEKKNRYYLWQQAYDILKREKREISRQELIRMMGISEKTNFSRMMEPLIQKGFVIKRWKPKGNTREVWYSLPEVEPEPMAQVKTQPDMIVSQIPSLKAFLEDMEFVKRKEHDSVRSYTYKLVHFYKFLNTTGRLYPEITKINKHNITEYLTYCTRELHYQVSTLAHTIVIMKSYFKWCQKNKYIVENIMDDFETPKIPEKDQTDFEIEDFDKIIDGLKNPRNKTLFFMMLATGARVSEVSKFNTNDISEKELVLHGKGNKDRRVPLRSPFKEVLQQYLEQREQPRNPEEKAVFLNSERSRLSTSTIKKTIKAIREKLGFKEKISSHSFRRAAGRLLWEMGMDIRAIQELLGHKNLRTTQKYVRVTKKEMGREYDRASEALFQKSNSAQKILGGSNLKTTENYLGRSPNAPNSEIPISEPLKETLELQKKVN